MTRRKSAYANELWNAMIRAVQWASYGDVDVPFPAPQVSNANLTAVVRFDGDNSGDLNYQLKTLNFLTGVAQDTGVVPLYTWVSSFVKKAGWDKLAPPGKRLENLGGEIGTHSKFHEIDRKMTPIAGGRNSTGQSRRSSRTCGRRVFRFERFSP